LLGGDNSNGRSRRRVRYEYLFFVNRFTRDYLTGAPSRKKYFKHKQTRKPDSVCPPFDLVPLHSSSLITVHLSLDPIPVWVYYMKYSVRLYARVRACVWGAVEVAKGYAGAAAAVMCVKGKVPLTNHQNNNTLQQCILYYVHIYTQKRTHHVHPLHEHTKGTRGCIVLNFRDTIRII